MLTKKHLSATIKKTGRLKTIIFTSVPASAFACNLRGLHKFSINRVVNDAPFSQKKLKLVQYVCSFYVLNHALCEILPFNAMKYLWSSHFVSASIPKR